MCEVTREEFEALKRVVYQLEQENEQQQATIDQLEQRDKQKQAVIEKQAKQIKQGQQERKQQAEQIKQLQSELDQQAEHHQQEIDEQAEQIEQLESELSDATDHSGKERAELAGRVSEIEQTLEDTDLSDQTPTPEGANTGIQQDELTPIEQLARSDDIDEVTDSQSVKRAVSIFRNLTDWGSKTPKGFVLKPADNPLRLLEADQDESLAWKQYYRAAEALERLSHGSVTFFDSDRHGKMICLHEQSEAFERVVNGSLSASSVGATS